MISMIRPARNHFLARHGRIGSRAAMLARDADITILDFETTGVVESFPAEPWQFGMVSLRNGVVDASSQFTGFIRVGERPFSPHAPGTWMQHLDEISSAPRLAMLWPQFQPRLRCDAIAAHSIGTEKKILRMIAPLHEHGPWIDTLKLARLAFPDWPSHTLEDVVARIGLHARVAAICPDRAAHDALFDAVAAAVLLEYFLKLEGWGDATVDALASASPRAYHRIKRRSG
jgi:DNA polymerase III epsilon subunit-like protein